MNLLKFVKKYQFHLLVIFLIGIRFFHFGPYIDDPHDWRQCDTAYYIWDFYKNGIDLFHPSVCWMGDYEQVILEFPLPEAVVALVQQLFAESVFVSRAVFLLFFLGAAFYFFQVARFLFGGEPAKLSLLVYLALPLSFFYSRAIHIDFFVLCFSYGMLYYFLKGIRSRSGKFILWSVLMAIPAFLVKVPYIFCLAIPMFVFILKEKAFKWFLPRAMLYLVPVALFLLWQQHVYAVNSLAPDWDFILHYRKFNDNAHWYFGDLARRLTLYPWKILTLRTVLEVAGIGGIPFLIYGVWKLKTVKNRYFILYWAFGLLLYVLVFFNLNVIHNYYQLPALAVFSILAATGIQQLACLRPLLKWLSLFFLILANLVYTERNYYEIPDHLIEIGALIRSHTEEDALVMVTYKNFDCRNPRILYRARRKGWSIEESAIKPEVIDRLYDGEKEYYWAYIGHKIPVHMEAYRKKQVDWMKIPLSASAGRSFLFLTKIKPQD